MWTVIKFEKKKIGLFKQEMKLKFGDDFKIYYPRMLVEKFKKNRIVKKEFSLLGDYIFCFQKNFTKQNMLQQIKFFKGVKYFLEGCSNSQNEINKFISKCKEIENNEGYITQSIFSAEINKLYKFSSGPFTEKIFKILNLQKNKISIIMGNIKTTIKKKEFLFNPV